MPFKQKIFIAVSGGVDSSVASALLKRQGYDVTGCFMKNWSRNLPGLECNWVGDREDALRVCAKLNVPFRTVDLEKTYYEKVFKNFISEYKAGHTPNPDILCNSEVKFKAFLDWAIKNGADMIATGHYSRIMKHETGNMKHDVNKSASSKMLHASCFMLHAAADAAKDQSYFLYRLGQKELSRVLFPIGGYTKLEVRKLAKKLGLPTADKPDSQGVCFVGEVSLEKFLENFIKPKTGKIIFLSSGKVVGEHRGVQFYTIGQRHGLGILGGGEPLHVAAKDIKKNILYVAPKDHLALFAKELILKDMHWISGMAPKLPLTCEARIRYRQPLQEATLRLGSGQGIKNQESRSKGKKKSMLHAPCFMLHFPEPQFAPASGQSVVFYRDTEVVGGGVIA